jgi:Phasin protein
MKGNAMPAKKSKIEDHSGIQQSGMPGIGLPFAAGTVAVQAWMDLGTETVRFIWDRLNQDIRTQQAMLACTSLEELRKVQADFFTAAQEQYAAEVGKMLDLTAKATAAHREALAKSRRYDDVPL